MGKHGLRVSRLGVGTAALGGLFRSVPESASDELLRAAFQAGIRYLDTAPLYGHGRSERRVGRVLADDHPGDLVISTKVGRLLRPATEAAESIFEDRDPYDVVFDFSADGVRRSLTDSLARLGVERVDLLYIHDPDDHAEQALREAYPALAQLREEGVVGAIGIGMNQSRVPTRFVEEADIDVVLIAGRYTLLDQSAQADLLPAAQRRGVSVVAAGVYNSGVLLDPVAGTYDYAAAADDIRQRAQEVREVVAAYGVPVAAAGLQFPLRHPAVDVILAGPRNSEELQENIAAFNYPVPEELWQELEQRGLVAPVTAAG
ncbi:aldo/keto reductase [Natronosporangium hydrolyticum]|uniref:Aldo/keto reductase n=1 Tax=Natronosporangium hydrolyticum TaxID=2811111 RepID=A0A895YM86_9ACTN|nr:aldo/keto reductase [Natronosporangium hydrolyticum]